MFIRGLRAVGGLYFNSNLFIRGTVDYNHLNTRLQPCSATLLAFFQRFSLMTALTALLRTARRTFVFFSCVVVLVFASSVFGQTPDRRIGTSGELIENDFYAIEDDSDEPGSQVVAIAGGTSSPGQTETNPKSHAPVLKALEIAKPSRLGEVADDPTPSIRIPSRFLAPGRFEVPENPDPYWQPLPAPKRFSDLDEDSTVDDDAAAQNGHSNKFHWRPAILQSLMIQSVQHSYAVVIQEKTRREFKGPWFKDWFQSVKNIHGWSDGNRFFTNYIAHPMQGGMTGFIYLQNHDRLKRQKFGESKTYWVDRLKAMAWSAAWSTQWEIGPFSQASIGNVGLKKGMAFVDLVVTPTVGTGWMIVEEALDRYIIRHLEKRSNFAVKMLLRAVLNPMRGVANTLRFKEPWYRDRPFGT
jgi:hypothetical protein